jgi:N4-(beta-N-acetylglucosaminyl)-L-asparaginase
MNRTRREFLTVAAGAGAGTILLPALDAHLRAAERPQRPVVIASPNGLGAVARAAALLAAGGDVLDAVVEGVNTVEDDPNDNTVGLGGLPNEDGVVELDAAVMHGPTHRAGAVASLRNIRNPSKVARLVMERTDHVLLVGEGALRFARAHGFREEDLLTEASRREWLRWKESLSPKDDWLPPHTQEEGDLGALRDETRRPTGTIHCGAVDARGDLACVTTTSGLAFKIAGRVGDSPIVGAGLYADNEVGTAGSTGRGEANLMNGSCVMIVEWMRQGKTPEEACLLACRRIAEHNRMRRLRDDRGRPNFNVRFYALNKRGEYGAASLLQDDRTFTVHDGVSASQRPFAYLFKR